MDGIIADLKSICDLADKYDALVMVDDSHAVGFMGKTGRGTHEYRDVMGRVDILTGTLGKALGGASGGYTSARSEIVDDAPPAVAALSVLELGRAGDRRARRSRRSRSAGGRPSCATSSRRTRQFFRAAMTERKFNIIPGEHPIVPIMIGDAALAGKMAERLLEKGVYAIGFSYPVVPQGKARIRVQVSAAHSREDLEFAIDAFTSVRDELGM